MSREPLLPLDRMTDALGDRFARPYSIRDTGDNFSVDHHLAGPCPTDAPFGAGRSPDESLDEALRNAPLPIGLLGRLKRLMGLDQ